MWNVALQVSIALAFHTKYSALYKTEEIMCLPKLLPSLNITKGAMRNYFEHFKTIVVLSTELEPIWTPMETDTNKTTPASK